MILFRQPILNHIEVLNIILSDKVFLNQLNNICLKVGKTITKGGKVIFAGNGGSFSDSQHLTAEFVCKFSSDRIPLPAITLGTNSSNLTAIGNDYGFEHIFSRELNAIGRNEDILITLSTSGNSKNIINLVKESENLGIPFFIFTGQTGGKLSKYKDNLLKVPSMETDIIQQIHILIGHIICKNIETPYLG